MTRSRRPAREPIASRPLCSRGPCASSSKRATSSCTCRTRCGRSRPTGCATCRRRWSSWPACTGPATCTERGVGGCRNRVDRRCVAEVQHLWSFEDCAVRNPLAVILALGAASLYGLGNALEHRVVTETETGSALDVGLLRRLARRPLWLLGMFGDVGAFGLQAAALALGTLLVVQPLLACGLLVALPVSARWTGRSIQRRELIAAVVLCASLATFLI